MHQYQEYLKDILDNGFTHEDRTGVGRHSVFQRTMRFDLTKGFPLVTTKKMFTRGMIEETLWFLRGSSDVRELQAKGVKIWDAWAVREEDCVTDADRFKFGSIGPLYGPTLRGKSLTSSTDQVARLIQSLRAQPYHSRHLMTTFDPDSAAEPGLTPQQNVLMGNGALYPCHGIVIQCFVTHPKEKGGKKRLSLTMYQRSVDSFLGLPFNIAQYSLLTMVIAQCVDMEPYEFIWTGGDCHVYTNHFDQIKEIIAREPYPLPTMKINPEKTDIFSFSIDDFTLENYQHHPAIKGEVAV